MMSDPQTHELEYLASQVSRARPTVVCRLAEMGMTQEQVAIGMGVSVARVSQIDSGDVSTQDVLNRFITGSAARSSSSPTSATSKLKLA
jgi:predicted transcriptional regulator